MHHRGILRRSHTNRILLGVCGGIGEYLGISPAIVRLLAIILPGIGWTAYFVMAFIMEP